MRAATGHRRSPLRRFRRRLRRRLAGAFQALGVRLLPPLYHAYMALVWRTSRVEDAGLSRLHEIAAEHGGAVGLLWHEEVATVAYAYPHAGFAPHTLASVSRAGALITALLERSGYRVFRGGSSRGRRRRHEIVSDMVAHMRSRSDVIYGLTVDGSTGPAYRVKPGGLVIARECQKPIVLVRTWTRRHLRLRTWDRLAIPLPFNHIRYSMRGPFFAGRDAHTREGLEALRRRLERELAGLAVESYDAFGQSPPANLRAILLPEPSPATPGEPAPEAHPGKTR